MHHSSSDDIMKLRVDLSTQKLSANYFVNSCRVKEMVILVQEEEQVRMRQVMLLILNEVAVPYPVTKDVMLAQVVEKGLHLKMVNPGNQVRPIHCCKSMAIFQ